MNSSVISFTNSGFQGACIERVVRHSVSQVNGLSGIFIVLVEMPEGL